MKKYPLVILLVLTLLFSGCGLKKERGNGQAGFSFPETVNASFSAYFGMLEAKGTLSFSSDELTVELTEPKALKGLCICVNKNETSFSLNGLKVIKENDPVLETLNANNVFSVLNDAKENAAVRKTDGGFLLSGDGYEIEFDSFCQLKRIWIPEKGVEIKVEY